MNDFLQSLRGNSQKEKRTPRTRRGFDNGNQYNTSPGLHQGHGNYQNTRGGNIKRPVTRGSAQPHMPTGADLQPPYIPVEGTDQLAELMDVFTKNQEMLISVQERRVMVEERKAIALEELAEYMRVATSSSTLKKLLALSAGSELPGATIEDTYVGDGGAETVGESAQMIDSNDFYQENNTSPNFVEEEELFFREKVRFDSGSEKSSSLKGSAKKDSLSQFKGKKDTIATQPLKNDSVEESKEKISQQVSPESSDSQGTPSHTASAMTLESANSDRAPEPKQRNKDVLLRKKGEKTGEAGHSVRKSSSKESNSQQVTVLSRKKGEVKTSRKSVSSPSNSSNNIDKKDDLLTSKGSQGKEGILSREEVMAIIISLREKGCTFDQVAQHLVDLGQPTFSGRGEWHAQTIHRLCKKHT
ncbi:hypothetical protein MTBBW1_1670071 [Desulfamplus magnetovallimortis]|uniref:Recombinase domain-containing protein n=1 Tax=Desulfamplus magnetovallimortis TaxID=1246637 RepID=A0A1W1H9H1_9BACT|nr:hypothetical protein [Desulfamplus magnetovallimortis]SLM29055.1 hypothetical protein MTBBW1_1670071 [Desulfamplus magnetovallimortis]